jgi:hypothetical protein
MKKYISFLLLFFTATVFATSPLAIQHVKLSGAPDFSVQFFLTQPAAVTVKIFHQQQLIRELLLGKLSSGPQQARWDLQDQQQQWVAANVYQLTLTASANSQNNSQDKGQQVVHDLSQQGNKWLKVNDVQWDAATQRIRYRLPQAATVLLRVGLGHGGPLLATIVDREPRAAGEHSEAWNGQDASTVMDLAVHPDRIFSMEARSLSENSWIVPAASTPAKPAQKMIDHSIDFPVSLKLPSNTRSQAGVPVLSGKVPIAVQVAAAYQSMINAQRFEPTFYVDGVYLFENELGIMPMTWHWETSKVPNGVHYLTLNLRGYDGSFGVATLKVRVEN